MTASSAERDPLTLGLVNAMASGNVADDVFAQDVFFDINVPEWRYQLQGIDKVRYMSSTRS